MYVFLQAQQQQQQGAGSSGAASSSANIPGSTGCDGKHCDTQSANAAEALLADSGIRYIHSYTANVKM